MIKHLIGNAISGRVGQGLTAVTLVGIGSLGLTGCSDINASGFNGPEKAKLESTIQPEAESIAQLVMAKDKQPGVSDDGTLYQFSIGGGAETIDRPHYEVYASVTKRGNQSPASTDVTKIVVTEYSAVPGVPNKVAVSRDYTLSRETGAKGEFYWTADETSFDVSTGEIDQMYGADSISHSDQVSSNSKAIDHASKIVADLKALETKIQ